MLEDFFFFQVRKRVKDRLGKALGASCGPAGALLAGGAWGPPLLGSRTCPPPAPSPGARSRRRGADAQAGPSSRSGGRLALHRRVPVARARGPLSRGPGFGTELRAPPSRGSRAAGGRPGRERPPRSGTERARRRLAGPAPYLPAPRPADDPAPVTGSSRPSAPAARVCRRAPERGPPRSGVRSPARRRSPRGAEDGAGGAVPGDAPVAAGLGGCALRGALAVRRPRLRLPFGGQPGGQR